MYDAELRGVAADPGQARAGEPQCEGQTSDPRPHDSDAWLLFHSHLTRGLRGPAGP